MFINFAMVNCLSQIWIFNLQFVSVERVHVVEVHLQENKNVDIMLADDLAMQGARSSAVMILIEFLWNTVFHAWEKA